MKRAREMKDVSRLLWIMVAPLEFAVTVLVGVFLYLGTAIYFAACVYLKALGGLFERAAALAMHRFRVGPIFSSPIARDALPPLSKASPELGPMGHGRFHSWLN